jgi:RimJ/RimL family protein N-acetyltransferase
VGHTLHTPRLDLMLLEPEAARSLVGGADPNGYTWAEGYPMGATLLEAELTARADEDDQPLGAFGAYQVIRRQDGTVIGDIAFHGPPDELGAVRLSLGIVAVARDRGYASEALTALLRWAREQDGLTCVLADTTATDVACQRVLERSGMQRIGHDGELIYYMA